MGVMDCEEGMAVKRLRVLQVVRPVQGGMRRHVLDLLEGLLEDGHEVTVACPRDGGLYEVLHGVVPVVEVELSDGVKPMADARAIVQLQRLLQRGRFDVVHLHGAKAGYVGRMAVRLLSRRPGVVYTVHNQVLPQRPVLKRVMQVLERRLAADVDRVITVSHALGREVHGGHRVPAERLVTIHNGVETPPPLSREQARAVLCCEGERLVIGAIGRMVPEKGFDVLIEAFLQLLGRGVDAELVLMGDGPCLSEYQALAGKAGLSRMRFLGEVPQAGRLLQGVDVLVQPSRAEGLGLVPIEAMLAGRPVIASDVGGLPEVVTHGETGLLVPPGDVAALVEGLALLADRADLRVRMGEAGRERARRCFSRQAMVEATLREYRAVVAERSGVLL
jgi:glycosyltransferase involved in cell wall biosynthesis